MEGEEEERAILWTCLGLICSEKMIKKLAKLWIGVLPTSLILHPPLTASSTCDHMQGHSEADGHVCCEKWCIVSGQTNDAGTGETAPPPLTSSMRGLLLMCRDPVCGTSPLWGWLAAIFLVTMAT